MTFDGQNGPVVDHPRYYRLEIQGTERNRDLWQKEAMWNIGGKHVRNASVLFFIDGDIIPSSPYWAADIIAKILIHDDLILQCFSFFQDSLPGSPLVTSWMYELLVLKRVAGAAPGLAWAMSQRAFRELNGFNALFPDGSADTAFVFELFELNVQMPAWFIKNLRKFDHPFKVNFHRAVITHIHHGKDRNYNNRTRIIDLIRLDLKSIIEIDSRGLLAWKSTNPLIKNLFSLERKLEKLPIDQGHELLKKLTHANLINFNRHFIYHSKNALQQVVLQNSDFAIILENDEGHDEIRCYSMADGKRRACLRQNNILADGQDNIIDLEFFFSEKINIEFKIVEQGGQYRLIRYLKKFSNRFLFKEDFCYFDKSVTHVQILVNFEFKGHAQIKYKIKVERQ